MIPRPAGIFSSQNRAGTCAAVPTTASPGSSSEDQDWGSLMVLAQEPHTERAKEDGGGPRVVSSPPFFPTSAFRVSGCCVCMDLVCTRSRDEARRWWWCRGWQHLLWHGKDALKWPSAPWPAPGLGTGDSPLLGNQTTEPNPASTKTQGKQLPENPLANLPPLLVAHL